MENNFVKASFDIHCKPLADTTPAYRIYVNQELFTERKWIWASENVYINQILQIEAPAGDYEVRLETPFDDVEFSIYNYKILEGSAHWADKNLLVIEHEST